MIPKRKIIQKRDNSLKCPLFILDTSIMNDIFNGRALNNQLFKKMLARNQEGRPFVAMTTLSAFQRAIYLSNDNASIQNIKVIMDLIDIKPSHANYKDGSAVTKELLKFGDLMSKGDL